MGVGLVEEEHKALVDFWKHRHDENVLVFFYDDLLANHAENVERLIEFINPMDGQLSRDDKITLTEDVVEQSSHATMSSPKHINRFTDHALAKHLAKIGGFEFDPSSLVGKVRKSGGTSGEGQKLLPEIRAAIQRSWASVVQP